MNESEIDSIAGAPSAPEAINEPAPEAKADEAARAELEAAPTETSAPVVASVSAQSAEPVKAEETAAPETKPAPEAPKHQVPLAVLLQERATARELKARLEEAEKRIASQERLEEEIRKLREPKKPEVSFEDEPLVVLRDELGNMRQTIEQDRAARVQAEAESAKRAQQEASMRQFVNHPRTDEERFTKQADDYYDALQFSREKNKQILSVYGYPEDQIKHMIDQAELAQANAAVQRGLSPAEVAYSMAQHMGYQRKAAAAPAAQQQQKSPEAQIAETKKKQAAAGLPTNSQPKVEDLADLPDSEFDAIFQEMFGKKAS